MASDFFSPDVKQNFSGRKFSRIVGNPPWSKIPAGSPAVIAAQASGFNIGDRQIAQVFQVYAPQFCEDDGELALLAPAKSTFLVTSRQHEAFRQKFLEQFDVRTVVNFAALRFELFAGTVHPAVAIFYRPVPPRAGSRITYGTPKPSPLSQQLGALILDATEVKYLDREELQAYPVLWKVALWGTSRDAMLIERLQKLRTLEQQIAALGWPGAGEGVQIGGGKRLLAPWLADVPFLPTARFQRYIIDPKTLEPIPAHFFHSPRSEKIVRGPLALIHHSPMEHRCAAAYSPTDVAYLDSISGVTGQRGQESILKWLVAYLNSPLTQYYQFMTSTRWGVERDPILHKEYMQMPFLIPADDDPRFREVLSNFERIETLLTGAEGIDAYRVEEEVREHESAIADLVFNLFGLSKAERRLVYDTIEYTLPYFHWSQQKRRKQGSIPAVQPPDTSLLRAYAETFVETARSILRFQGQALSAVVYQDGAPLSLVGFRIVRDDEVQETQIIQNPALLRKRLAKLDRQLLEKRGAALYTRRHVRIYDGSWLYLVRPSEGRFWTRSQARLDAGNAVVEWLVSGQA